MRRVGKFAIHLRPDGTFDLLRLTAKMEADDEAQTFSPRRADSEDLGVEVRSAGVLIVVDEGRILPVLEAITETQAHRALDKLTTKLAKERRRK